MTTKKKKTIPKGLVPSEGAIRKLRSRSTLRQRKIAAKRAGTTKKRPTRKR